MHNILQAKKIEDQRDKIRQGMSSAQESPLVSNVIKTTRTERKTEGERSSSKRNKFMGSRKNTEFEEVEIPNILVSCKRMLEEEVIREAMKARERHYVSPVMR